MATKQIITTRSSLFLNSDRHVFINRVSESFTLKQHKHEFIEINYVSEGHGYQYIEGQTIPVAKGDLFYLPLGVSHVFRPSTPMQGGGKLIVYNCLFDLTFAAKLSGAFPEDSAIGVMLGSMFPKQAWLHVQDQNGLIQRAFDVLLEEYLRQEEQFEVLLQAEIMRVLVYLHRMSKEREDGGQEPRFYPDRTIDTYTQRLQDRPGEKVQLKELAAEAGLSERQFRRRFQERTGMSFMEYVQKCRIELSCELLRTTQDKIAAIALQAGYQDIKFFNRLFKSKTGMTPREYRERI